MKLEIDIPNDLILQEELIRLKMLLGKNSEDKVQIEGVLLAALAEYKTMLLGNGLPTRADEIKQLRLLYLIKYHYKGRIPTEIEVSQMFQLTESESRSLIKNVTTRFRYQLEKEINETLKNIMSECKEEDGHYEVNILSQNNIEELNKIIAVSNPAFEPIKKKRDSSKKYIISEDSFELIKTYLGA